MDLEICEVDVKFNENSRQTVNGNCKIQVNGTLKCLTVLISYVTLMNN